MRRRVLLAGGLGVVLGGGAGAGSALAATSGDGPAVPSPGEAFMTEHGVLKRILLCYRAFSDRIAAGTAVDPQSVHAAAQIVSDYVESFHESMEEAYVFPRVRETLPDLVRTLLVQHDRGRHLTGQLLALTDPAKTKTALDAFVRMYEPHEAWEDTVVYPELRRVSTQGELDALALRVQQLQATTYAAQSLAAVLARVTPIEQQLGIGDVAAFTPAS